MSTGAEDRPRSSSLLGMNNANQYHKQPPSFLRGITFDPKTFAPTVLPGKELEYLELDTQNPISKAIDSNTKIRRGWSERMCFNVGSLYFTGIYSNF